MVQERESLVFFHFSIRQMSIMNAFLLTMMVSINGVQPRFLILELILMETMAIVAKLVTQVISFTFH